MSTLYVLLQSTEPGGRHNDPFTAGAWGGGLFWSVGTVNHACHNHNTIYNILLFTRPSDSPIMALFAHACELSLFLTFFWRKVQHSVNGVNISI